MFTPRPIGFVQLPNGGSIVKTRCFLFLLKLFGKLIEHTDSFIALSFGEAILGQGITKFGNRHTSVIGHTVKRC